MNSANVAGGLPCLESAIDLHYSLNTYSSLTFNERPTISRLALSALTGRRICCIRRGEAAICSAPYSSPPVGTDSLRICLATLEQKPS